MIALVDTIDHLTDQVVAAHRDLSKHVTDARPAGHYCSDPAAAWAADAVVRGRTVPINTATVLALTGALKSLRVARSSASI